MKIVVKPLFLQRTAIEHWLSEMAESGYLLQDVSLMIFQGFGAFRFVSAAPCHMRYALYEQRLLDDHETWLSIGWEHLCTHDGFTVYQTKDELLCYPLLKLPKRFYRRLVKSLLNISFVLWLLILLRKDPTDVHFYMIFLGCFCLLVLPNVIGLKAHITEMRMTRLVKNLLIGVLFSLVMSCFVVWLMDIIAFYR